MKTCYKKYSDPEHPEHKEWLLGRRERFRWILDASKRCCKLTPEERELVTKLRKVIKDNNVKLEMGE
jgi:hypothetical protein